jgi:glyoxylase-like metal-dependent hydrolase (beta-lactamase superfamily II)
MSWGVDSLALKSPTLPPATTTNCYFLGDQDFAIVDPASPWPEEQARLLVAIESRRQLGQRPAFILLTHHHWDHVAGVQALRTATQLPVVAHARTAELLAPGIVVDRFLGEGDTFETGVHTWTCLHTPGHATGHLCFFNEKTGALVLGDMVAGEGTIVLDPPEGNLAHYLASLQTLKNLNSKILFPAHGPPIRDPMTLLEWYCAHRNQRTEQIRKAIGAREEVRAADLVGEVYPELPLSFRPVAVRQILCHLQYLSAQGELNAVGEVFQRPPR